jgi:single-strand DNA-binding protein
MNKVILVGNLTKDPELTTTQSGINVARFTIAVQRKFKNANDEYESDFINCVAWRSSAEFIHKYFNKGNKIGVVGSIQTRSYDAEDGTKRYVTEVVVEECEFVQSKKGDSNNQAEDTKPELEPIDDDGLPF